MILPGRYADDRHPGSLRNQVAIIAHARRLADASNSCEPTAWRRWCPAEPAAASAVITLRSPRAAKAYDMEQSWLLESEGTEPNSHGLS